MYLHILVFLKIACPVCILLLVLCCQSWVVGTGQTILALFPWGRYLSHSQLSTVASRALCRVEVLWTTLPPVWHGHGCHPCWAYVVVLVRLCSIASKITRRYNLIANSLIHGLLRSLFCSVPSALGAGGLRVLQRAVSLMGSKTMLSCEHKSKCV